MTDSLKPLSSYAVPICFLAADSTAPGSFGEIEVNEVRMHGLAAEDTEGAEVFGMETDPVPEGVLSDKWRRVEAGITKDLEIIARCQAGNPCPALAKKLIDLSQEGAGRSGRASGGVINIAVNLAIGPASDVEKRAFEIVGVIRSKRFTSVRVTAKIMRSSNARRCSPRGSRRML